MKTVTLNPKQVPARWYVVDASGKTLGRLATRIVHHLRGKHKPEYCTHLNLGDYVIVVNAAQIRVTGNKESDKTYFSYSGYMGGVKTRRLQTLRKEHPSRILKKAVQGMLPKNALGRQLLANLKIYAGPSHPHAAQSPEAIDF